MQGHVGDCSLRENIPHTVRGYDQDYLSRRKFYDHAHFFAMGRGANKVITTLLDENMRTCRSQLECNVMV